MILFRNLTQRAFRNPSGAGAPALVRDVVSGGVAGLVMVTYCISFSALIFQGPIEGDFTLGLSALLTGTLVTGLVVATSSTLTPTMAGPDTPAVAVMSALAAAVVAHFAAAGFNPGMLGLHVMLAITFATLLTGLLLFTIGTLRLGVWLRFVPYPVVGGFLAASGWLLITGGLEVMTGVAPRLSVDSLAALVAPEHWPQLVIGVLFAAAVLILRQRIRSFLVLPVTFFTLVALLDLGLLGLGMANGLGGREAWYLAEIGELQFWMPARALVEHSFDWGAFAFSAAEIGAVCGVTALSVLLDVSGLEVARQRSADLDMELRSNGLGNIAAGLFGGVAGNLSMSGSVLIEQAGGASRFSGVAASLFCGLVLLAGADAASLIPTPLLGGLLLYLGIVILSQALLRSPAQRSLTEFLLAAGIMAVIVYFGYLLGVVFGVIGACLLFAISYSRIGVVRRHLTRAEFSSNLERSPAETRLLREHGERIHVLWLTGFIFFGSSNGLFEFVRRGIERQTDEPVRYVLLDFSAVPGLDSSAILSLVKLRNYCDGRGVTLAFAGLSDAMRSAFETSGLIGGEGPHRAFPDRNEALEWCEDALLSGFGELQANEERFEDWLRQQFAGAVEPERLLDYFERHTFETGDTLLEQGSASDSLDLLATGCVAITVTDAQGHPTRLRRMVAQTVIGEMGFFRQAPRAAAVVAEEPAFVYRLTRKSFERMRKEDPEAASAFYRLIIRILSERLEFANREISALV